MKKHISVICIVICIIPASVFAVEFMGGEGLFYTQAALTSPSGMLRMCAITRNYGKMLPDNGHITNNTLTIGINFGFSNHLELSMTQILYQDIILSSQDNDGNQYPDDTYIRMKLGNLKFFIKDKPVFLGFLTTIKFRTGAVDNIYLEPYVSYGISGKIDMLVSYYVNPFFPEESPAFHANIGYINYNDHEELSKSSQAVPFSIGYVRSTIKREYFVELHGLLFVRHPTENNYSCENFMYIAPGYKYKLFMGFSVTAGLDILLFTQSEKSIYNLPDNYPQYPEWRLNLKFDFIPSTGFYHINSFQKVDRTPTTQEAMRKRRIIISQKDLFDWVVDETTGADYIDLELEKVRTERKKAEEELERLKEKLEKKSSGK